MCDYNYSPWHFALGILALRYVIGTYTNDARSMVIYWPLWAIQIVIPYACFSSALRHLAFAADPALKPEPDIQG